MGPSDAAGLKDEFGLRAVALRPRALAPKRAGTAGLALGVLIACLALPRVALAEACQFLTSGSWGPLATLSSGASVDCAGGAVTADDTVTIPSGVAVTVVDDLSFGGTLDLPSIVVEAGGSLTIAVASLGASPSLRLNRPRNSAGLQCREGSTCHLTGAYREFGSTTPALQPDRDSAGFGVVGHYVPCPGWDDSADAWVSDCSGALSDTDDRPGTPNEAGFIYPHAEFGDETGAGGSPPFMNAALDATGPGDVLCFGDPEPDTPAAPVDDGFCYEVTSSDGRHDSSTSGVGHLVIDLRQTNPQSPKETTYPLAVRGILEAPLEAAVAVGDRFIEAPSTAIDCSAACRDTAPYLAPDGVADRERVGMWLRFEDAGGAPSAASQRISRSFDDPQDGEAPIDCQTGPGLCDLFEIYDPAGFGEAHAAGERFWIDYGHAPGETFFIFAPVHLTGLQQGTEAGRLLLLDRADFELRAALIDGSIRIQGAELEMLDVVVRDATSPGDGNGSAIGFSLAERVTLRRVSFTGGNDPGLDAIHGITIASAAGPVVEVWMENVTARHIGDDFFSTSGPIDFRQLERIAAWWATSDAASCNLIGQNNEANTLTGTCKDCVCVDCASNNAGPSAGTIASLEGATDMRFEGFLRWGTPGHFMFRNLAPAVRVVDYFSVGGDHEMATFVDGFVVALVTDAGGGVGGSWGVIDRDHQDVRNGIVRDYTRKDSEVMRVPRSGVLHNIAFIDVAAQIDCASSRCSIMRLLNDGQGAGDSMEASNLSFIVRPGSSSSLDHAIRSTLSTNHASFDDLLVANLDLSSEPAVAIDANASRLLNLTTTNTGTAAPGEDLPGVPCFFDTLATGEPDFLPPDTVTGSDAGFVDPAFDRFDPAPAGAAAQAGCGVLGGARAPGITRYRYMHALTRTVPEVMADDPDHDGLPTDPAGPFCAGPDDRQCADSCAEVFNPDQLDADLDGVGDLCNDAEDGDGDEWSDALDNCPGVANADQADADLDGQGDPCDGAFDLPDLIAQALSTESVIVLGKSFDLGVDVFNAGLGSPGPISINATFQIVAEPAGPDPILLAVCTTAHPLPAETSPCPRAAVLAVEPSNLHTWRYEVCVDSAGAASEADETNNCAVGPTVSFVPEPSALVQQLAGLIALRRLARRRQRRRASRLEIERQGAR